MVQRRARITKAILDMRPPRICQITTPASIEGQLCLSSNNFRWGKVRALIHQLTNTRVLKVSGSMLLDNNQFRIAKSMLQWQCRLISSRLCPSKWVVPTIQGNMRHRTS